MLIPNLGNSNRYLNSDPGIIPPLCNSEARREADTAEIPVGNGWRAASKQE